MVKAIERRKSSVLGQYEWLTTPWSGQAKAALQRIMDNGFRLASLMEQSDRLAPRSSQEWLGVRYACITLSKDLRALSSSCLVNTGLSTMSTPYDSIVSGLDWSHHLAPFQDVLGLMYIWSLDMLTLDVLLGIKGTIRLYCHSEEPDASSTHGAIHKDQPSGNTISGHVGPLGPDYQDIPSIQLHVAKNILKVAPYFLQEDMGWFGPARLFFPLTCALEHIERVGSPDLSVARELQRKLFSNLRSRP